MKNPKLHLLGAAFALLIGNAYAEDILTPGESSSASLETVLDATSASGTGVVAGGGTFDLDGNLLPDAPAQELGELESSGMIEVSFGDEPNGLESAVMEDLVASGGAISADGLTLVDVPAGELGELQESMSADATGVADATVADLPQGEGAQGVIARAYTVDADGKVVSDEGTRELGELQETSMAVIGDVTANAAPAEFARLNVLETDGRVFIE